MQGFRNLFMEYAVVKGGLHGRPRGTVAGIIYGAARSREGKVVTAREYVIPGDTDDEDVLNQRLVFKSMVMAAQYLSSELWKEDFDLILLRLAVLLSHGMRVMVSMEQMKTFSFVSLLRKK